MALTGIVWLDGFSFSFQFSEFSEFYWGILTQHPGGFKELNGVSGTKPFAKRYTEGKASASDPDST